VLIHGLTPPIDKKGFWVHNIVIIGSALKPDRPLRLPVA
jgi:hypothetical protein